MFRTCVMAAAAIVLAATPVSAKTLRFGLAQDPDMLDPTLASTYVGRIVFSAMCDKLVDISPNLEFVPQLATSWSWSDDQKALTLKLRPGVKFQDGEPMDAEAVKFSLERHLTMQGSKRRSEISAVTSIDVVDPLTVRLNLKTPFAPLLAQLSDRAGMIVSPKAAKALGDKFATAPVCAGPFKFVERVAQDHITLDKFQDYWNAKAVHLDRVEFRIFTDAAVRLANLKSGQLDFLERLAATDVPQVKSDPKLKLGSVTELGYLGITINVGNGPKADNPLGKNPKVREAFDLAIDRDALVQVVFNGEFQPGNQWVSPTNPNYSKSAPMHKPDIAKAKQLLKEAGVPLPVVVNLMTPTDSDAQQVAQVVQAMTKEAGFDVRIQSTEFATSLALADKGDFEAYYLGWSGRTDPDGNLYTFMATGAAQNRGHYSNPEVDALLKQSRETNDMTARRAAWDKIADILINRDRPLVYLYHRKWLYAFTNKLADFHEYPDGLVRFTGLDLK